MNGYDASSTGTAGGHDDSPIICDDEQPRRTIESKQDPRAYSIPIQWGLEAKPEHAGMGLLADELLNVPINGRGRAERANTASTHSYRGSNGENKRISKLGKQVNTEQLQIVALMILSSLYSASFYDPSLYLGISLKRGWYSRGRNPWLPDHVSYRRVKDIIEHLKLSGWIDFEKGYPDLRGGDGGRLSKIRSSSKLLELFDGWSTQPIIEQQPLTDDALVQLRDAKGKAMPCPDGELARLPPMLRALRLINDQIASSSLGFTDSTAERLKHWGMNGGQPINPLATQLYRVFNKDFEHGGRFYGGWWQNIPKAFREHITIDGQPTVELDYSSLHLSMLYSEEGLPLPSGDLYDIGWSEEWRSMVKASVMALINAPEDEKAIKALINMKKKEVKDMWEPFTNHHVVRKQGKRGVIVPMLAAIRRKHAAVLHWFGKAGGTGATLQTHDALIAQQVMQYGAWQNITVLPVHDSFIVRADRREEFDTIMRQAYSGYFGGDVGVK